MTQSDVWSRLGPASVEQELERMRDINRRQRSLLREFEATIKKRDADNIALRKERDAAFAMSKCECSADECCANLVAMGKERDAARAEVETLRHDIARHVSICASQAQELEELRADLAAARALPTALSDGYLSGTVSGSETAHSIRLHYRSRRQAEKAFHALTDAIDAALAGEKK